MNKYNKDDWTYGVELEYSDVYRFNKLPEGAQWNSKDYSIVSTSGVANDPNGELYAYGGEINTKPTKTIKEQVQHIQEINDILDPKPVINYKCNLHIHIRVLNTNSGRLKDDLDALKKVMKYIHDNAEEAFQIVDPLQEPTKQLYPLQDELDGSMKRYRRNRDGSHHGMIPESRYEEIMASNSPLEFYEAHAPMGKNGRQWQLTKRAGINMRQLFDAPVDTIEFRHFFGTTNMVEMESCLIWCSEFLNAALNTGEKPLDIIKRIPWLVFPKAKRFDLRLQRGFERTTPHDNKFAKNKEEIKRNIEMVLQEYKDFTSHGTLSDEEISKLVNKAKKKSLFED